jgi:hypothetical protein
MWWRSGYIILLIIIIMYYIPVYDTDVVENGLEAVEAASVSVPDHSSSKQVTNCT